MTSVQIQGGETNNFPIIISLHQGSTIIINRINRIYNIIELINYSEMLII